jgi:hypothetical protein
LSFVSAWAETEMVMVMTLNMIAGAALGVNLMTGGYVF